MRYTKITIAIAGIACALSVAAVGAVQATPRAMRGDNWRGMRLMLRDCWQLLEDQARPAAALMPQRTLISPEGAAISLDALTARIFALESQLRLARYRQPRNTKDPLEMWCRIAEFANADMIRSGNYYTWEELFQRMDAVSHLPSAGALISDDLASAWARAIAHAPSDADKARFIRRGRQAVLRTRFGKEELIRCAYFEGDPDVRCAATEVLSRLNGDPDVIRLMQQVSGMQTPERMQKIAKHYLKKECNKE